jgi:hypothetical protein
MTRHQDLDLWADRASRGRNGRRVFRSGSGLGLRIGFATKRLHERLQEIGRFSPGRRRRCCGLSIDGIYGREGGVCAFLGGTRLARAGGVSTSLLGNERAFYAFVGARATPQACGKVGPTKAGDVQLRTMIALRKVGNRSKEKNAKNDVPLDRQERAQE